MLTHDVKVKTLTVGGRPKNGPMAYAGGSKGSEVTELSDFAGGWRKLYQVLSKLDISAARSAPLNLLPTIPAINMFSARFNSLNTIRKGALHTPTQYIVDYSDCRIWYTPQTYAYPGKLWEGVYETMWGDNGQLDTSKCIAGSTKSAWSSTSAASALTPQIGMTGLGALILTVVSCVAGFSFF